MYRKTTLFLYVWLLMLSPLTLLSQSPTEALCKSIESGDTKEMKKAIKKGAEINSLVEQLESRFGRMMQRDHLVAALEGKAKDRTVMLSPMHMAAALGNDAALDMMIKKGGNPDLADSRGMTPLMYAFLNQKEATGLMLIKRGVNLLKTDENGNTALHYAALGGCPEGVYMTSSAGVPYDQANHDGTQPMHCAAVMASPDAAEKLAFLGADANVTDSAGFTPLHYAGGMGQSNTLVWYKAHGVDPAAISRDGYNLLDLAMYGKNKSAIDFAVANQLKTNRYLYFPLMEAMKADSHIKASLIIQQGANPNSLMEPSPLVYAASHSGAALVALLVLKGADPNYADSHGRLPLVAAIKYDRPRNVEVLINYKADAPDSILPMAFAAVLEAEKPDQWTQALIKLTERTVNTDQTWGSEDMTALHYACWYGNPLLVGALTENGAPVNAVDRHGWTPLHYLMLGTRSGEQDNLRAECARLLMARGANPNLKSTGIRSWRLPTRSNGTEFFPANATPLDFLGNGAQAGENTRAVILEKSAKNAATAEDWNAVAAQYLKVRDYKSCMQIAEAVMKLNPKSGEAYFYRGMGRNSMQQQDAALKDLDQAVKLSPRFAEAWWQRGLMHYQAKRYAQARGDWEKAAALNPDTHGDFWFLLGYCYLLESRKADACKAWKKAEALGEEQAAGPLAEHCK